MVNAPELVFRTLAWLKVHADSHPAHLPDPDEVVMVWVDRAEMADGSVVSTWLRGWWDGAEWHDCEHGGVISGRVTAWSTVLGPHGDLAGTTLPEHGKTARDPCTCHTPSGPRHCPEHEAEQRRDRATPA